MRIIPALAFLAVLVIGSQFPLAKVFPKQQVPIPQTITQQDAYNSICSVASRTVTAQGIRRGSNASGIVLSTGDVLTAAHVVDQDNDGELSPDEIEIDLSTLESGFWVKGDVIAYSDDPEIDLALIRPRTSLLNEKVKGAYLADQDVGLGNKIKVIGRRRSLPASITLGVANPLTSRGQRMTSASCWFGGSGGGTFDENNKLVGVAISIGRDTLRSRFNVPITNENSLTIVRVNFGYKVPIPDMTFYVPLDEVKKFLDEHKSTPGPKPLPEKKELPNPHKKWFYYFMVYPLTGLLVLLTGLGLYRAYRGPRRR